MEKINQDMSGLNCSVVVVPSLRDVHHDCVFPQPPYRMEFEDKKKNTTPFSFFPNPSIMKVNGITIGVSTNDIIKHLSGELVFK